MLKNKLKPLSLLLIILLLSLVAISTVNATNNNTITNSNLNNSTNNLVLQIELNTQNNLSSTEIQVSNTNQTYNQGESLKLNLSSNNVSLNNKNITLTLSNNIGSKSYYLQTDSNGTSLLPITLYPGTYNINYTFNGDESYLPYSGFTILTVNKINTQSTTTNISITYNAGKTFDVNLTDENNQTLNNQIINITLSLGSLSKTYSIYTDINGKASLPINLYPNTYTITYNYYGTKIYNPNNGTAKLVITKVNTTLTLNNNLNIGKGDYLNLSLYSSNGNPINSQYISITLSNSKNQSKTYNILTNSNGIAKLQLNLNYGEYYLYYIFSGTTAYYPSNNGNCSFIINGTIIKANDLVLDYPGYQYFNINLTDGFNNPLINKTVNLLLNNNSYNLTTDENGIAKLNIIANAGTYPAKFTYTNNDSYFSSNGSATITINKIDTYITGENINTSSNSGTLYNLTLYDYNNKTLSNKQVTVTLYRSDYDITAREDKTFTYTLITNNNGVASLLLNQGAGYYTIEVTFNGDENYYTSTINNDLFINGTVLVALDRTMAAYANDEFTIKLKDMEGNLIANQTITLTINSDTYTLTTNNNGVASVNLSYAVGNYTMNYYYTGLNGYLSSNDTSMLLISLLDIKHGTADVSSYLVATTNCQVNNALIQSTAKSITANCTTDYEKAVVIFNYVRDTLKYSSYSNTVYGAYKTLVYKVGNCCDHAHLICALSRAVGLASRYYHGTCYFTRTGNWVGHVWASVLVGNSWLVMDATSSKNLAGYVNTWKNSNYVKLGVYATLPF